MSKKKEVYELKNDFGVPLFGTIRKDGTIHFAGISREVIINHFKVVDREGKDDGKSKPDNSVSVSSPTKKARPLLFNVGWNAPPYKDEVFVSLLERIGESITLCVGSDICRCDRCQIFRKVKFVVLLCLKELEKKKKVLQGKDKWKYEVVLWSDVLKIIGEKK